MSVFGNKMHIFVWSFEGRTGEKHNCHVYSKKCVNFLCRCTNNDSFSNPISRFTPRLLLCIDALYLAWREKGELITLGHLILTQNKIRLFLWDVSLITFYIYCMIWSVNVISLFYSVAFLFGSVIDFTFGFTELNALSQVNRVLLIIYHLDDISLINDA